MRVTLVNSAAAPGASDAPSLPPELMAAVAARYSRSGDGLDAILAGISDPGAEAATDRVLALADYGHASIGDMALIHMFIDGISVHLAWQLWMAMPRGSGQETSTRYVRFDAAGVLDPETAGIPTSDRSRWAEMIASAFQHYHAVHAHWLTVAETHPHLVRIPLGTRDKAVPRLRRNFAFDRARYLIPAAAMTNVVIISTARDWVEATRSLLSSACPEAVKLGTQLAERLQAAVPRLSRHATPAEDHRLGQADDLADAAALARTMPPVNGCAHPGVDLEISGPRRWTQSQPGPEAALIHHPHRYAFAGRQLGRWSATLSIEALALGEMRDLARHRTGNRFCTAVPVGFYGAADQAGAYIDGSPIPAACSFGVNSATYQRALVSEGRSDAPYWALLGTQLGWEHQTTLRHMIYQIELRTGPGSHWRYAEHMLDAQARLMAALPRVASCVLVGSAEPE